MTYLLTFLGACLVSVLVLIASFCGLIVWVLRDDPEIHVDIDCGRRDRW